MTSRSTAFESTTGKASWFELMQQNPKVNGIIQALPDQRTFQDVVGEIDRTPLRYWGIVIGFLLLALTIAVTPTVVLGVLSVLTMYQDGSFACRPDGSPAMPYSDSYNVWSIKSILDISIAFGDMPFPVAKLIDVMFDLVVGRGGQVLLSLLLYRVLGQALLHSMESRRSSFRSFSATAFETGTFNALRIFFLDLYQDRKDRNRRSTFFILATVVCTAYVVLFPTIISGITGYQSDSEAFAENPNDGSLFDVQNLRMVEFIITDGSRIGLADNYQCVSTGNYPTSYYALYEGYNNMVDACNLYWITYCSRDGCPSSTDSVFVINDKIYNLTAPSLTLLDLTQSADDSQYLYGNVTITGAWLKEHMQCQPTKSYQWGCSLLGLFLFFVFTLVFCMTLYAVWLKTYLYSRLDRSGRRLGTYRAVVDMATALQEEFTDDLETMSDKQFREELEKRDAGIMVNTGGLPDPRIKIMKRHGAKPLTKPLTKLGRYHALRKERAASRPFEET